MNDSGKIFLASLAVFRELYNSNKDVYQIICEFLKEVISHKGLHKFTSTEITEYLKEIYGFEIPEAVIRTSLKKRLKGIINKTKEGYVLNEYNILNEIKSRQSRFEEIKINNDKIINNLFSYIERKKYSVK